MDDREQNVVEHLGELRKRLIISAIAFLLFLIVGFVFVQDIFRFFMGNLGYKLMVLGPSDIMLLYFHVASIIAIAGAIPVAAWQMWLFVKPNQL